MVITNIDLNTQLNTERKFRQQLDGNVMVDEDQAQFSVPALSLPFNENIILQLASRLLLNSFDWIKSRNNAFKLLEYLCFIIYEFNQ